MRLRTFLSLLLCACSASPLAAGPLSREVDVKLARSLQAVGSNQLDVALNEVDSLLRQNPNFKLAQLMKGDLLLARTQPLAGFGNAPNAPRDQLQDLREEARARLRRAQQQPPITVPKYLWQLDERQRYAVVVDTSQSTLYLYENVNGEPRYVTDYYVSIGKKGADKSSEGDQKTPLGVYFVEDYLPPAKLTDFYGAGAYSISYPNEWDKRQGRSGHGIWLHGTPPDTYSRAPRASNGCVVLANEDLLHLGRNLQSGLTPVIITPRMEWSDDSDLAQRAELLNALEQWRSDWESRDTERYLRHYAPEFSSGATPREAFARQKRQINAGKSWIKVRLQRLSMFTYPNQPDLVVVNFQQDYESNNLSNRMLKRQYWKKHNGRWQIVYEGAA